MIGLLAATVDNTNPLAWGMNQTTDMMYDNSPAFELLRETGFSRLPVFHEDLVPGVVCLPEGIWTELDELGVDRAGSANLLTSTQGTPAGKAPVMHGVGVEVEPEAGSR